MALEVNIQELKEPMEDKTSGKDQPMLDSKTINLGPSFGSTIPESTATSTLLSWSSMKWGIGSVAQETSVSNKGSSWN